MPIVVGPGAVYPPLAAGSGVIGLVNQTSDGSALGDLAKATAEQACEQNSRNNLLGIFTALQVALQTTQLILYFDAADDAIDARDEEISAVQAFQLDLDGYALNIDFNMLNIKSGILTSLGLPGINQCADASRYALESLKDGDAVDAKSEDLANQSCEGIPQGWGTHDGSLYAGRAGSYAGGIISNSSKRRVEKFREQKTNLALRAQANMKTGINAGSILAKYSQASSIHSGLADLYIQGFNSAGAGLGTAIGQLANSGSAPSTSSVGNWTGGGVTPGIGGIA